MLKITGLIAIRIWILAFWVLRQIFFSIITDRCCVYYHLPSQLYLHFYLQRGKASTSGIMAACTSINMNARVNKSTHAQSLFLEKSGKHRLFALTFLFPENGYMGPLLIELHSQIIKSSSCVDCSFWFYVWYVKCGPIFIWSYLSALLLPTFPMWIAQSNGFYWHKLMFIDCLGNSYSRFLASSLGECTLGSLQNYKNYICRISKYVHVFSPQGKDP